MRILLTILFFSFVQQVFAQIPISDSMVYDFSGATRKGGELWKYFTNNIADDGRITREVADFNRDSLRPTANGKGWRGMVNLQQEYNLDSFKYYDKSGSVDTIWLWTFDRNNAPKWDTICNPENYTPDYIIITCGTCSGLPITTKVNATAGDKVQFIYAVIRQTDYFAFGQWHTAWADIHKLQFFGSPTGLKDTTYNLAPWAMNKWTPRKISDIIGNFNLQNQQDTLWSDTALVDNELMRNFDSQQFFDNQNVAMGSQAIDLGGGGYTAYKYNKQMSQHGHYQYAAVFGNTTYFDAQLVAMGHAVSKGWSTNTPLSDPQLPASYSRKGYYMHGLAWLGGTCSGCTGVRTYNGTATPAMGYLKILGTSNEPTLFAFANAWKNPIEVAAEAIGVYDSVKVGDPNVLVMLAGYEAYNYDDAKATVMLMKLWSRSRSIKIDGIDVHAIHTLKTDSFPYIPTTNQQIGNYGVDPGYWDDWHKNNNIMNGLARETGNPNLKFMISEDTYQKGYYKRYPTNSGETFSVSQLAAPGYTVGGVAQDRLNSQAIGAVALDFIISASGIYQHYWYTAVDEIVASSNPGYDAIDGSNGKFQRPATFGPPPTAWPSYFLTASRRRRLGNYVFSDTVTYNPHGLAVFKYKHFSNSDSLMFEYRWMDSTGTATVNLAGLLGVVSGKIITPSFTSRTATETTGTSNSLPADPLPRGFIVYAPGGSGPIGGYSPPKLQIPYRVKPPSGGP